MYTDNTIFLSFQSQTTTRQSPGFSTSVSQVRGSQVTNFTEFQSNYLQNSLKHKLLGSTLELLIKQKINIFLDDSVTTLKKKSPCTVVCIYTQAAKGHYHPPLDQCQIQAPISNSESKFMCAYINIKFPPVKYCILFWFNTDKNHPHMCSGSCKNFRI